MTKDLFDQILALVLPEMGDARQRQALVESACIGAPVLEHIEWTGAAWPFSVHLLARLARFGEIRQGESALAALLVELRGQLGVNRQAQIDALLPQLNGSQLQADEAFVTGWQQAWEPAQQNKVQPPDWQRFRLGRIAEWSQPRYDLEKRFVNLTLLLDRGESEPQRWHQAEDLRFNDLRDVLAETSEHPALVLLGAPGSGKSTLLRRLQLDHSLDRLRDEDDGQVSFFIPLNSYRASTKGELQEPREWLQTRWQESYVKLGSLDSYLQAGRVLLLLDALNEMPHKSTGDYFDLVGLWREFAQAVTKQGNRVVFTCRSLDYSAPLSGEALRVPQVEVQPMTPEQVKEFLNKYTPDYVVNYLASLRLTMHEPQAQVIPCTHGIPWLGFVVYPTHRRIKARNVVKFSRRLRERWDDYCAGQISFAEFDTSVQGRINHVRYADTWGLRKHVLGQGLVHHRLPT